MEEDEFFYKIFILGDVNVGKTCFLTRYLDNTFSEETKNTIGIDFRLKTVQIEDGSTVKLQIFETNENINTSPMLKFDLKSSHGIILTFSVISKKSFENIPAPFQILYSIQKKHLEYRYQHAHQYQS